MSRVSYCFFLAAAAAGVTASAEAAPLISFSLNLPAPRVAVNQAIAPYAIAGRLSQQGFRVQDMHRKGPAYAVTAIGRHGNRVLLMVDGYSGVIIGMSVLQAAVPVVPVVAPNAVFIDDTHPFGAVVPEVVYDHWEPEQWAQPGPAAIVIKPTYAPYQYAVPFKFVHASPRSHKSYALAPPKFHGMRLRNSAGQQIHAARTRADAADSEAAYQAERADQATYDKEQALDQRDAADQRADDLDKENDALANDADAQQKRAEDAEARADVAEKQLEQQGQADDPCGSGCMAEPDLDDNNNTPEQEDTPADDNQTPVEAEPTSPEGNPTEEPQAPQQDEPAPQQQEPAPQQQEEPAPQQQEEPAPQQQEEPAPQQQEEPAPQQEEQQPAQQEEQPQQQEEQPQQQEEQQQEEPQQQEEEPQQQEEEPQQGEEPQMDDSSGNDSSGDDSSGGDDSPDGGNA